MPDRMPNRMSEDMSDRMPDNLPVRKGINVMVGITRSKVIFVTMTETSCNRNCSIMKNHRETKFSEQHFANTSPLPRGAALPLQGGASPPCHKRLQVFKSTV